MPDAPTSGSNHSEETFPNWAAGSGKITSVYGLHISHGAEVSTAGPLRGEMNPDKSINEGRFK